MCGRNVKETSLVRKDGEALLFLRFSASDSPSRYWGHCIYDDLNVRIDRNEYYVKAVVDIMLKMPVFYPFS